MSEPKLKSEMLARRESDGPGAPVSSMRALDKQEGGAHYKGRAIQPIEYIHANSLGFCEGSVVKYVTRHKSKNGKEDLLKAIHFLELLCELEYEND